MKFHSTLVDQLIDLFEINAGWSEQRKLREALAKFDLTVYTQENGDSILVSTKALDSKIREQEQKGS
jgi:hypothetical protein